jgi:hypothetical protein
MLNTSLFVEPLKNQAQTLSQFPFFHVLTLVSHSIFLGLFLAIMTYFSALYLLQFRISDKLKSPDQNPKGKPENFKNQMIMGCANILFLCVGMTGVMILVNNNLARAFAIGAALALVRFRVSLEDKSMGANLLFGIIAGISCGLNEMPVAYILTGAYTFLQFVVLVFIKYSVPQFDRRQDYYLAREQEKNGVANSLSCTSSLPLPLPLSQDETANGSMQ